MAESEEELQSILMKLKEESEKAGLKLNIQKTMSASKTKTAKLRSTGSAKQPADGSTSKSKQVPKTAALRQTNLETSPTFLTKMDFQWDSHIGPKL